MDFSGRNIHAKKQKHVSFHFLRIFRHVKNGLPAVGPTHCLVSLLIEKKAKT